MTPIPRDFSLSVNPPREIHTILDLDRGQVWSDHEVWQFIDKDVLHKQAIAWGEHHNAKDQEDRKEEDDHETCKDSRRKSSAPSHKEGRKKDRSNEA